jgi:hypothetical protein
MIFRVISVNGIAGRMSSRMSSQYQRGGNGKIEAHHTIPGQKEPEVLIFAHQNLHARASSRISALFQRMESFSLLRLFGSQLTRWNGGFNAHHAVKDSPQKQGLNVGHPNRYPLSLR